MGAGWTGPYINPSRRGMVSHSAGQKVVTKVTGSATISSIDSTGPTRRAATARPAVLSDVPARMGQGSTCAGPDQAARRRRKDPARGQRAGPSELAPQARAIISQR
ncbi:hypothetical protein GCM10010961_35540 [Pseudodonghicola xiamenensis]|uniref:Uncharacterized protein n=1 Tax=Pseudodonghicola xiamenensis TaxID=337702 RepID=A0A8J3HB63_9RHOB|nr:hypothetical protein GCM10010961_35540 [Pseudodonghicola xiamenensis]